MNYGSNPKICNFGCIRNIPIFGCIHNLPIFCCIRNLQISRVRRSPILTDTLGPSAGSIRSVQICQVREFQIPKLGALWACRKYLCHSHFQQQLSHGGHDSSYVVMTISTSYHSLFRPILVIVGVLSNILVCFVMRRPSLRNNSTCFYMFVLAILDIGK